jgi:cytochrome c biogenesis factor
VKKADVGIKFTVANVIINLILQVILVGTKGMFITPASRIREGLMLSSNVPFRLINMILMILAFIGLVLVVVMNLRARTKDKDAGTEISVSEA